MKSSELSSSWSLLVCWIALTVFIAFRTFYSDFTDRPLKVTTWDAFGYYMYVPSTFIYHDHTELKWVETMDEKYSLTGGELYQADKFKNGNYVNKYLGGVAILQTPLFAIAHLVAWFSGYPMDGFSAPYQYSIAYGALLYVFLALLLMRKILLRYYNDETVAYTILFMVLASNLIQYVSVDGGMSHAFIFPLYALLIWWTIKWHETPKIKYSLLIGLVIGIAMISRPTEVIMLFIPLLWGTDTKESASNKWKLVKDNRIQIIYMMIGGIIGIMPQLIYWKWTSGQWIYDVGSKWFFLNPYFRVLFGFENGWFIYTPIAIFFIVGFFFIRGMEFRKAVIVYCLLNIWIIIAWSDWKYGATYSTRALTQSYPILLLSFGGFINWLSTNRYKKWIFLCLFVYLSFVNLFQIWQYNAHILHYRDMNRMYYASIYLKANPDPLAMSFLDTQEYPKQIKQRTISYKLPKNIEILNQGEYPDILLSSSVDQADFIHVKLKLSSKEGFTSSYINCKLINNSAVKEKVFRIANPIAKEGAKNDYEFYVEVPAELKGGEVLVFTSSFSHFSGTVHSGSISQVYQSK